MILKMKDALGGVKHESGFIEEFQHILWPYAYNILGDQMAAEDSVQIVLNRYVMRDEGSFEPIHDVRNYLIKSVINQAINDKKRIQSRRETYPGEWLPSPVYTEEDIYATLDRKKIIHYSLLVMLEKLTPHERAVFILKELYHYSHSEVADTLSISIENSRQLFSRGKYNLRDHPHHLTEMDSGGKVIVNNLMEAMLASDVAAVSKLLHHEVQSISDGGPKQSASSKIVVGQKNVLKLLGAIFGKYMPDHTETHYTVANHLPALIFTIHGKIFRCMTFEIIDNLIEKVYVVVNPDKL